MDEAVISIADSLRRIADVAERAQADHEHESALAVTPLHRRLEAQLLVLGGVFWLLGTLAWAAEKWHWWESVLK